MKKLILVLILASSSCGKPVKVENFGVKLKPSLPVDSSAVKVDSVKDSGLRF